MEQFWINTIFLNDKKTNSASFMQILILFFEITVKIIHNNTIHAINTVIGEKLEKSRLTY